MSSFFSPSVIEVPNEPLLTRPIENEELLLTCKLTQFDREGYELLPIEQEYYISNGIGLHSEKVLAHESGNSDEWKAFVQMWFEQTPSAPEYLKLDHSFCVTRYAFEGEARKQIQKYVEKRPELNKLLNIRYKWGADFCLDYVTENECFELVHWEWDFLSVEDLAEHINVMEEKIGSTEWDRVIDSVRQFRQNIFSFDSESEGNFKATLFGLPKAFRLYKTFS